VRWRRRRGAEAVRRQQQAIGGGYLLCIAREEVEGRRAQPRVQGWGSEGGDGGQRTRCST
jgi:hypothetical protein